MRKRHLTQQVLFGVLLILLSVCFYSIHFLLFRDAHHIFIYLLGDIGFVFIEVLLVTLIIHHLLAEREKRAMFKKLNMVIGAFSSEVGLPLLEYFCGFDAKAQEISNHLLVDTEWSPEHFAQMQTVLKNHDYKIDSRIGDLEGLKEFLVSKRGFLLRLLENPNLLEHEEFTELLWAVFHLAQELSHRPTVEGTTGYRLRPFERRHTAGPPTPGPRVALSHGAFEERLSVSVITGGQSESLRSERLGGGAIAARLPLKIEPSP